MTQFHIEDRVQHNEDRYKAGARRGGKGKTEQESCNMNDVYVFDTSEQQLLWALAVFRYNAKEVRSDLSASSRRSSGTRNIGK
jgi:hypothetical protein